MLGYWNWERAGDFDLSPRSDVIRRHGRAEEEEEDPFQRAREREIRVCVGARARTRRRRSLPFSRIHTSAAICLSFFLACARPRSLRLRLISDVSKLSLSLSRFGSILRREQPPRCSTPTSPISFSSSIRAANGWIGRAICPVPEVAI